MTPEPVGGKDKPQIYQTEKEEKKTGTLGNRTFTNETQKAKHYDNKIPHTNLYPKGEFLHLASQAFEAGGLGALISFIFTYLFASGAHQEIKEKKSEEKAQEVKEEKPELAALTQAFAKLKQLPIDENPLVFFRFYSKIEQKAKDTPLLKQVKQEITRRLKEMRSSLEERMPKEEVKKLAEEAEIPLASQKFSENVKELKKTLTERKEKAFEEANEYSQSRDRLITAAEGLKNEQKETIPKRKAKATKAKNDKESAFSSQHEKEFLENTKELREKILTLENSMKPLETEQAKLNDIKNGKVKHYLVMTVPFTETDRLRLETVEKSIKEKKDELTLLTNDLALKTDQATEKERLGFQKIADEYIRDMQSIDNREKAIQDEIEKNQQEQDALLDKIEAKNNEHLKLEQVETKINKTLKETGDTLQSEVKKFVRLSFFEKAFAQYQELEKKEEPAQFIRNYLGKEQQNFIDSTSKDLESVFGSPPASLDQTIRDTTGNLIIFKQEARIDLEGV